MKNSLENFPQAGEQKEVIKPTHSFYFSKEAREFIDSYYPDITEDDDVYAVMKKIEEAGITLDKWDINIRRGILTGCNVAFFITEQRGKEIEER